MGYLYFLGLQWTMACLLLVKLTVRCMHVLFCSEQQTDQGERHRLPHSHGARCRGRDGEAHPRERRGGTALSLPRSAWAWANTTPRAALGAGAVCGSSLRARTQRWAHRVLIGFHVVFNPVTLRSVVYGPLAPPVGVSGINACTSLAWCTLILHRVMADKCPANIYIQPQNDEDDYYLQIRPVVRIFFQMANKHIFPINSH